MSLLELTLYTSDLPSHTLLRVLENARKGPTDWPAGSYRTIVQPPKSPRSRDPAVTKLSSWPAKTRRFLDGRTHGRFDPGFGHDRLPPLGWENRSGMADQGRQSPLFDATAGRRLEH